MLLLTMSNVHLGICKTMFVQVVLAIRAIANDHPASAKLCHHANTKLAKIGNYM